MSQTPPARILTIAGSDSGGGAGIQADLKTITVLGGYGMTALTALTAQNTLGVDAVDEVSPEFLRAQLSAVTDDIGVDAAKTGMLANADLVEAVIAHVNGWGDIPLVVDPVMVSTSGHRLLAREAEQRLARGLLPHARVVTPNVAEAAVLSGRAIQSEADFMEAGEAILDLGPDYVVITGGHGAGQAAVDYVFHDNEVEHLECPRVQTRNTHGTGCTFSAAVATRLGQGYAVLDALRDAKAYLTEALKRSSPLGHGNGPPNHLWPLQADDPGE